MQQSLERVRRCEREVTDFSLHQIHWMLHWQCGVYLPQIDDDDQSPTGSGLDEKSIL